MWTSISDLKQSFKTLDTTHLQENYSNDAVQIVLWLKESLYHNPATTETYRQAILRFYLWMKYTKNITLHNCTRHNVIEYIEFIRNIPTKWQGTFRALDSNEWRPFSHVILSQRTINYSIQLIHQLFTYLHQTDYITKNPLALPIKKVFQIRRPDSNKYFSKSECASIYRHILNLPEESKMRQELKVRAIWIFKLLVYTGCRRAEVLNANMDCLTVKDGQLWLNVIGKGHKAGVVPIIPQLEQALNEYRYFYDLPAIRDKSTSEKHIPLIIKRSRDGDFQSMSHGTINHQLKKICAELADKVANYEFATKLNNVSAHWFRHTAATIQANSGVDMRIVQKNLRHASIETTAYYQHTDKMYQHTETSQKFDIGI